jgi:succinyl-CoA synthetase alpha subunit
VTVVFGEPSSRQEYDLAEAIQTGQVTTPVVALIAGRAVDNLPATLSFGHAPRAGSTGEQSVADKLAALKSAGAHVVTNLEGVRAALDELLPKRSGQGVHDDTQSGAGRASTRAGLR